MKPSVEFVKGNIFESSAAVLVNPVNCIGVSGAGLALAFKNVYPHHQVVYEKTCRDKKLVLGKVLFVNPPRNSDCKKTIVYFPTKDHWKDLSKLEYVQTGLEALWKECVARDVKSIAIPALGCGLGHLDWKDVKPLISKAMSGLHADVEVYLP